MINFIRVIAFDLPETTPQRKYEERYQSLLHSIAVAHPFIESNTHDYHYFVKVNLILFEVVPHRQLCIFESSKLFHYVNGVISEGNPKLYWMLTNNSKGERG